QCISPEKPRLARRLVWRQRVQSLSYGHGGVPRKAAANARLLYLALKKEINLVDLLGTTLMFLGVGLLLGSIVIVILYSMTLTNLLYCGGALLLASYILISAFKKSKFNNLLYCLATICLFATILF
ncbi:MAG: hypothetical protein J6J24_00825, partial [Clostridia bacterium]|nr:hypothetical protein [Clostridia bacterium]